MNQKSKFIFGVLGVLIIVGAVGYFIYKDITKIEERRDQTGKPLDLESGGVKVEVLPTEAKLLDAPIPDLNKSIKFYNDHGVEFERLMTEKIEVSRRILRKEPTQFREWVELGINYKRVEDFKSAEEMWQYAHLMIPDNAVVLGNLANLYAYDLKDLAKADEYYVLTLEKAGGFSYLYFQIAEYYQNVKKDKAKAIATVELGIQRSPNDTDLQGLLQFLKSN